MISPNPNETYDEWVERSRQYELEIAFDQLKNGSDTNSIVESMSYKLIQKMMYPIFGMLKSEEETTYDSKLSRLQYDEYMNLKGVKPKADHIIDDK